MGKRDKFNNVKKFNDSEGKSRKFERRDDSNFSNSRDDDFTHGSKKNFQ